MGDRLIKKLHRQLTLVNVTIILLLFAVLTAGAYFFFQHDMNRRTDEFAGKLQADIKAGRIIDLPQYKDHSMEKPSLQPARPQGFPPGPPPGLNFFFVKTSAEGAVTFQSSGQPFANRDLAVLVEQVMKDARPQGVTSFYQSRYGFYKSSLGEQPGMLIIFHDMQQDFDMLRLLLTALTVVGAICSLLSFAASFFMARRAIVPINEALRQQSNFLSDASHELRTPLAIIQTNLDIALANKDDTIASQYKWLTNIREETVHMARLVDSLLFLARADSNRQLLELKPFSISAALERAAAPFEPLADAKQVILTYPVGGSLCAYGDETRIKQVIGILLDNAIRHTPAGGKVTVTLEVSGQKTVLAVSDTGEGIAAEYHEKIFDRFFQIDKSRNDCGAGLGLAIAKWIIERHMGTIAVRSTPGAGTTFIVSVPRK
jgi:two-component system sensor histidine kinase CiaH